MIDSVNIPEGKYKEVEIRIDTPSGLDRLQGKLHGQPLERKKYTRLMINNQCFMTDAEFEERTNSWFVYKAKGDVLIAGLGIGFVIPPLVAKEEVTNIDILENNYGVIKLVYPHYKSKKVNVFHRDVFRYTPDKKYDTIYFDIWPNTCTDYYSEIVKLKSKFKPFLNRGGWMGAWCESMMRGR